MRSINDAIAWSVAQHKHPTQNWKGMCASHVRQAYGVPAQAASAILWWKRIPAAHKHVGGKPSDAPRGAALFYSGGKYGHVALAVGKDGKNCLSNDYQASGKIGLAPRTFPRWGLKYLGWSYWTDHGEVGHS